MTRCACKGAELSCIIGNIFTELRPPCDMCGGEAVTIHGITPTGHEATIKFYGRYMDDFYLIHEDKEYLRYCWKEIERHVNELGLSLNAKTNIYPLKNGIDFLGFHSYLTESGAVIRKVRRKSKNNARRRLTKMRGLLETGKITPEKVEQSYKSWRGHASKGNCYHLIRNMDQHYNKLFGQYAVAGNRGGVAVSEEKEEGKECRKS